MYSAKQKKIIEKNNFSQQIDRQRPQKNKYFMINLLFVCFFAHFSLATKHIEKKIKNAVRHADKSIAFKNGFTHKNQNGSRFFLIDSQFTFLIFNTEMLDFCLCIASTQYHNKYYSQTKCDKMILKSVPDCCVAINKDFFVLFM